MGVYNDGQTISIQDQETLDYLWRIYTKALPSLKIRSVHVLKAWQDTFPSQKDFLEHFLSADYFTIWKLKNCGRLTADEIRDLQRKLLDAADCPFEIEPAAAPEPVQPETLFTPPANIDEILPLFKSTMTGLSTRSANRVEWLLKECDDSLAKFYERICDPACINSIPTIGKKSRPELIEFFDQAKEFLRQFPDEESVSAQIKHHLIASPSALGLPDYAMDSLHEMESSLGRFPLFAAIQLYIENRPDEERAIIEGCLDIYEGQDIPERTEVAAALNLSPERVRQKRNKLIERLPAYFKTYANLGFVTNNPYRWQMTHVEEEINASEGTNFNLNFVCWVLGSVFDELTLIGDSVKSIGGYFELDPFLCIVPTALVSIFDFDAFLQDLDDRMKEKRINEQKVSLRSIISSHLTVQYCDNELPEIDTTCRTILYLHYPVEVDQGYVIFPANAYKTNVVIVEEILRDAGHPMTLSEIIDEYMYQYPERDAMESSLRGAINTNPHIVPVGRSSTYALAEWNREQYRGGTIRQFVEEYLNQLEFPLATASDVFEYVSRFRPDTNESSLSSNLMQEQSHKFCVLSKDGVRYYGYSNIDYGDEYRIIGGERPFKRSLDESMTLLEEFILREGHYPYCNEEDPEEKRLYRFVGNRRSACTRNAIPQEEIDQWIAFEDKYREFDTPRHRRRKRHF